MCIEALIPWTIDTSTSRLQAQSEYRQVLNIFDQDQPEGEEKAKGLPFCSDNLHYLDIVKRPGKQQDAKDFRCSISVSSNGALSARPIRSGYKLAEPHAQPAGGF